MPDRDFLIIVFLAPLVALIPFYVRLWQDFRRPTGTTFARWRPWLRFTDDHTGQQNHLPRNQEQHTPSAVFWLVGSNVCLFRLRFVLAPLGSIGRISWSDAEVHVEGRISPLTIASPLVIIVWFDVFVAAAYWLGETTHNLRTLMALVGSITAVIAVTLGLVYLMQFIQERMRFRRAYREIKARIWSTA